MADENLGKADVSFQGFPAVNVTPHSHHGTFHLYPPPSTMIAAVPGCDIFKTCQCDIIRLLLSHEASKIDDAIVDGCQLRESRRGRSGAWLADDRLFVEDPSTSSLC